MTIRPDAERDSASSIWRQASGFARSQSTLASAEAFSRKRGYRSLSKPLQRVKSSLGWI